MSEIMQTIDIIPVRLPSGLIRHDIKFKRYSTGGYDFQDSPHDPTGLFYIPSEIVDNRYEVPGVWRDHMWLYVGPYRFYLLGDEPKPDWVADTYDAMLDTPMLGWNVLYYRIQVLGRDLNYRLLATARIWDVLITEPGKVMQWRDLRIVKWLKARLKR